MKLPPTLLPSILLVPWLLLACDRPGALAPSSSGAAQGEDRAEREEPSRQEEALTPLPADFARGVCLAHNWQNGGESGYGTSACGETLEHLDDVGVTHVSLTPFGWMNSAQSAQIGGEHTSKRSIPEGGETIERLAAAVAQARQRGMEVMLKPHLWIRGGAWRGEIDPGSEEGWATWWESYEAFMLYYARAAQAHGIESLVVGVELVSAVRHGPDRFLSMIEAVREVYDGKLLYSANWDEEVPDRVWRALDVIGTQLYPPLTQVNEEEADVAALREALRPHLRRWHALGERVDRPVMLTEVGYKSAPGALARPFEWPEHLPGHSRKKDEVLQERAYQALMMEVRQFSRIEGMFIWKYFTDPVTDEEGSWGFSPRGKRAEQVLREAFASPEAP